jgi:hypothetical protein
VGLSSVNLIMPRPVILQIGVSELGR